MKALVYGDVHWSTYSSIIRKRNEKYSQRLDNLIQSVSWAEKKADELNCDKIICLGDFFDKPELNAEEISALEEVIWSSKPHVFLVGNHESNVSDLSFSSTKALSKLNFKIIDQPSLEEGNGYCFMYLPYILEEDRKLVEDYWKQVTPNNSFSTQEVKRPYIFSHNDLKGVQYGCYLSTEGFDLKDLADNCYLCINGHLHNGGFVDDKAVGNNKILNLGDLTGLNFSENAFSYTHNICVIDTDKPSLEFMENPYAFNFYKLSINSENDFAKLYSLKSNAVCTISCAASCMEKLSQLLVKDSMVFKFADVRVIMTTEAGDPVALTSQEEIGKIDHLAQFRSFTLNNLGDNDIVKNELTQICGGNN